MIRSRPPRDIANVFGCWLPQAIHLRDDRRFRFEVQSLTTVCNRRLRSTDCQHAERGQWGLASEGMGAVRACPVCGLYASSFRPETTAKREPGLPREISDALHTELLELVIARVRPVGAHLQLDRAEQDALSEAAVTVLLDDGERALGRMLTNYRYWRKRVKQPLSTRLGPQQWREVESLVASRAAGMEYKDLLLRLAAQKKVEALIR